MATFFRENCVTDVPALLLRRTLSNLEEEIFRDSCAAKSAFMMWPRLMHGHTINIYSCFSRFAAIIYIYSVSGKHRPNVGEHEGSSPAFRQIPAVANMINDQVW